MKGTYCIVISLEKQASIRVGKLGLLEFRPGFYAYVGSALGGLEARIQRHLSAGKKKRFWHIDYLLEHGAVAGTRSIISPERLECDMAGEMDRIAETPINGFGSSDCSCRSHLYYFSKNPLLDRGFEDIWTRKCSSGAMKRGRRR